MAGPGISHVVLMAAVGLFMLCCASEVIITGAESKGPATGPLSYRLDLMRRDSPANPYMNAQNIEYADRLRQAFQRSHNRLRSFFQNAGVRHSPSYSSPVNYDNYEFLMQIGIGSPDPLKLHVILDTGSDLIWTQCMPCANKNSCIPQEDPFYSPSRSTSFTNESCSNSFCKAVQGQCDDLRHCNYFYMYGDLSLTSGNMGYETFSLRKVGFKGRAPLRHIAFGCGRDQSGSFSNSSGIVGMGRGPLSLVSQIGSSIGNIFSYCLTSIYNVSQISPLFLGDSGLTSLRHRTTPLIHNKARPSFYYLDLRGISVNRKAIPLPKGTFQLKPNGQGGLIIDSGTTLTYLEDPAYKPLLHAVRASITSRAVNSSSVGLDLCYKKAKRSALRLPKIAFHFGGGSRYVLPTQNSFMTVESGKKALLCLAFASAGPAGSSSVFGNVQQQNFHIAYDLGQNQLHFAHTNCASL